MLNLLGRAIERQNREQLRGIDPKDGIRELWRRVKDCSRSRREHMHDVDITAEDFNIH